MLINDLEYYTRKSNYVNQNSGMDDPQHHDRDFYDYPIQDFDYQFNSWGFRGPEYEQYRDQPVNICVGDSFTVNLGGPVEHSWCSQLAEHFSIPTLNLGMDGAGNDTLHLVHSRACELFDVQNTFVMYSYLHRRLKDGVFTQHVDGDEENFSYFLQHRLNNAIECALPMWNWTESERIFLHDQNVYFFDTKMYFADYQHIDRKHIVKQDYNNLKGPDWPTLEDFQNGADPHSDMFTEQFGQFISHSCYVNRDGHHNSFAINKQYADWLYKESNKG